MDKRNIESVKPGWDETVIMVCSRCGEQFKSENERNAPERIKSDLKSIAKSRFEKGKIRVITTSCLNICPENKIAVVAASKNVSQVFNGYAVHPDVSGEQLFEEILKKNNLIFRKKTILHFFETHLRQDLVKPIRCFFSGLIF